MRGGHNRKPTALKLLSGTAKPERENPREPAVAVVKVPPPPETLGAIERAVWVELAAQVESLQVYAASDYTSFRMAVKAIAMADGDLSDMPATAAVRMMQVAASMLQRFGLDPASRAKVAAAPAKAGSTHLDEFGHG